MVDHSILMKASAVSDQNVARLIDRCRDAIELGPFRTLMDSLQDAVLHGTDSDCRYVLRQAAEIRPHLCAELMYQQFVECLLSCAKDPEKRRQ